MVLMDADDISRCAQESIDIIIMKNDYNYLFFIKIILITYLPTNIVILCALVKAQKQTAGLRRKLKPAVV